MTAKVLVLGSQGMLGHQVFSHLSKNPALKVVGTQRRNPNTQNHFDAEMFLKNPRAFDFFTEYDYLINCIGVIKPFCREDDTEGCTRAIQINGLFPRVLNELITGSQTKLLQIATDCVFSGASGNYHEKHPHDAEDTYGKSKSLGEVIGTNVLHLRCSIIGPEQGSSTSLLGWFLSQPKGAEVVGFDHHWWNGVTTLQFSELCEKIILDKAFERLRSTFHVHHFIPNESVSKYQLLHMFREVFKKDINIIRSTDCGPAINRTLRSEFQGLGELYPRTHLSSEIRRLL